MRPGVLLLCAPLAWLACEGPIGYRPPKCSGQALDLASVGARSLHVRVLVDREGQAQRHELVLDARPGRVVAIGLTPMGSVAYRITHDGEGVQVENRMGRFLGLDAERAYDAVVHGLLTDAPPAGDASLQVATDADGSVSVARADCRYTARLVPISDRSVPASEPPPTP